MNTQNPSSEQASGQVQALLQKYTADPAFKTEFDAATTREDAVHVAARHGIVVSAQDIAALGQASPELSDDILYRVSGGESYSVFNYTFN